MTHEVLFSTQNHLGIITLNRPEALNALSYAMMVLIKEQLVDWQHDTSIAAVLIQSHGKAFCVGGDVRAMAQKRTSPAQQIKFLGDEYRLNHFIHTYPKPYIALLNGMTMGGGVGISMHGSHPIASEKFIFAMPETKIGFFPDVGASHLFAQCPLHWSQYLGLTGEKIDYTRAFALGLIQHHVPSSSFERLVNDLSTMDLFVDAHARVTACIQAHRLPPHAPDFDDDAHVRACFSPDSMMAIEQQLTHHQSRWARDTLQKLRQCAPMSLRVTQRQLHLTRTLDFAACLNLDLQLAQHFLAAPDFYEGVRAVLIDKDHTPHWHPYHLREITEIMVDHYFQGTR